MLNGWVNFSTPVPWLSTFFWAFGSSFSIIIIVVVVAIVVVIIIVVIIIIIIVIIIIIIVVVIIIIIIIIIIIVIVIIIIIIIIPHKYISRENTIKADIQRYLLEEMNVLNIVFYLFNKFYFILFL